MGFEAPMKMKKRKPCRRDRLKTQEEFFFRNLEGKDSMLQIVALSTLMATSKPAFCDQGFSES